VHPELLSNSSLDTRGNRGLLRSQSSSVFLKCTTTSQFTLTHSQYFVLDWVIAKMYFGSKVWTSHKTMSYWEGGFWFSRQAIRIPGEGRREWHLVHSISTLINLLKKVLQKAKNHQMGGGVWWNVNVIIYYCAHAHRKLHYSVLGGIWSLFCKTLSLWLTLEETIIPFGGGGPYYFTSNSK
jgi:hypothetical protein